METDQAELIDVPLSESAQILNKNCDTEETDASTTFPRDNRSLSPFDNQGTQIEILMAEKWDTSLAISGQQLEISRINKSIILLVRIGHKS